LDFSGDGCVKVVNQQKPKIEVLPVRCKPNSKAGLSTGRSKIDYGTTSKHPLFLISVLDKTDI